MNYFIHFYIQTSIITGGIIITQDYQLIYEAVVAVIFGPVTRIAVAGKKILDVLQVAH